jgi:DNA-binding MarR family transcriptional regulator
MPESKTVAQLFIDTVPMAMVLYRDAMRNCKSENLSVPQFRILAHLTRQGNSTNRELSDLQGVTVAAMSRMIENLVERGFVSRSPHQSDRRQVWLALTDLGMQEYLSTQQRAVNRFSEQFLRMAPGELAALSQALETVKELMWQIAGDLDLSSEVKAKIKGKKSSSSRLAKTFLATNSRVKGQKDVKRRKNQKAAQKKRKNLKLAQTSYVHDRP